MAAHATRALSGGPAPFSAGFGGGGMRGCRPPTASPASSAALWVRVTPRGTRRRAQGCARWFAWPRAGVSVASAVPRGGGGTGGAVVWRTVHHQRIEPQPPTVIDGRRLTTSQRSLAAGSRYCVTKWRYWSPAALRYHRCLFQARDASEGKGPQRRPQKRLDGRLEEVAEAVVGGYCRLQMPWSLALAIGETVGGSRLGTLEGGRGAYLPPLPMHPWLRPFAMGWCYFRGKALGRTAFGRVA